MHALGLAYKKQRIINCVEHHVKCFLNIEVEFVYFGEPF